MSTFVDYKCDLCESSLRPHEWADRICDQCLGVEPDAHHCKRCDHHAALHVAGEGCLGCDCASFIALPPQE